MYSVFVLRISLIFFSLSLAEYDNVLCSCTILALLLIFTSHTSPVALEFYVLLGKYSWRFNLVSEILRLIRRLIMKELWPNISLQQLTLRALRSALVDNPRGQNHFRSIGGLEVLLDGLGVPSIDSLVVSNSSVSEERWSCWTC